jgi:hypothetical protein
VLESWDILPFRLSEVAPYTAQQTKSIASHLVANNININANKTTTIVGSNLQANTDNGWFVGCC